MSVQSNFLGASARRSAVAIAVFTLFATLAADATAQRPQRYSPSRPTVSPYLNLLRTNVSPVPNYYALVRPQIQQNEFQRQQQEVQLLQNAAITRLQSNLLRNQTPEGPVSGNASWFQNPGSRSQFNYTGRYYLRSGTVQR